MIHFYPLVFLVVRKSSNGRSPRARGIWMSAKRGGSARTPRLEFACTPLGAHSIKKNSDFKANQFFYKPH